MKISKSFTFIATICFILISISVTDTVKPVNAAVTHIESVKFEDVSYVSQNETDKMQFMNLSFNQSEQHSEIESNTSSDLTEQIITENALRETTKTEPTTVIEVYEEQTEQENEIESEYNSDYTIIKTYSVPKGHSFKSYTNYKLLSSNSPQGKLQSKAYTGSTGIRMVEDYYCAALGTYYEGNIGDKYLVTLEGGKQFKMILCDVKSDSNHQYTRVNGCVIEFYVDYSVLSSYIRSMGDISYIDGFKGEIIQIQKISC